MTASQTMHVSYYQLVGLSWVYVNKNHKTRFSNLLEILFPTPGSHDVYDQLAKLSCTFHSCFAGQWMGDQHQEKEKCRHSWLWIREAECSIVHVSFAFLLVSIDYWHSPLSGAVSFMYRKSIVVKMQLGIDEAGCFVSMELFIFWGEHILWTARALSTWEL